MKLILIISALLSASALKSEGTDPKKRSININVPEAINTSKPADGYTPFTEGYFPLSKPANEYINKAREVFSMIRERKNYIDYLDHTSSLSLPVGIQKRVGGIDFTLGIASINILPSHAFVEVFMQMVIPQNGDTLTFASDAVKLSSGGFYGDTKIYLVGDYALNLKNGSSRLIFKGNPESQAGTSATISCAGFESLMVVGEIEFSRNILLPADEEGNPLNGTVKPSFNTEVFDWNDLIAEVQMEPFITTQTNNFVFIPSRAVLDFSDKRNTAGFRLPEEYGSSPTPDWKGVFLPELNIRIPRELSETPAYIKASNLLLDATGISGNISAARILDLDKGKLHTWSFSMDSVHLSLMANQLLDASASGKIAVPITGESTPFDYRLIIQPENRYMFSVSPTENLQFPVWQAGEVKIEESSLLEVTYRDNSLVPRAILHGEMNISADIGEETLSLGNISFEELTISTTAPYIEGGHFAFDKSGENRLTGFPIMVEEINTGTKGENIFVDVRTNINLSAKDHSTLSANSGIRIIGQTGTHWTFEKVEVEDITIEVDKGSFQLYGAIAFYKNDQRYGNGFMGVLDASFQPGISLKANALFGNKSGDRYWFFDFVSEFNNGLPLFSGVAAYGIGGGGYNGMFIAPSRGANLGTASGLAYLPDPAMGMGFKATIIMGSHPSPEAFNLEATLEMAFFRTGGLRYIRLKGEAAFAELPISDHIGKISNGVKEIAESVGKMDRNKVRSTGGLIANDRNFDPPGHPGQIFAQALIEYSVEEKTLHGNFNVFVNIAEGAIKGSGESGKAGQAVLHFSPGSWYIHAGTPENRLGLKTQLGPLETAMNSYFLLGDNIPPVPQPSENVRELLNIEVEPQRNESDLTLGRGIAFGSSFHLNTGDLNFLMFYSKFDTGIGFDLMLKKNASIASCAGKSSAGINGWYGMGQAYGHFNGNIGININLMGSRRNIDIIELSAAVLLEAGIPNPIWLKGTVGGSYSILGGTIQGDCRFEVTLGEQCGENQPGALEGMPIIAEVTPRNNTRDTDVFAAIQGVFNIPLEREFELKEDEELKKVRVKLNRLEVKSGGKDIPGELEWNGSKDIAAFNPVDILPPQSTVAVKIAVGFEEYQNGLWAPYTSNGETYVEERAVEFQTGEAPDYIPLSNVLYSYPAINQKNFYRGESSSGYILLKRGQPYLFEENKIWKREGRIADGTEGLTFDFQYNDRTIAFELPRLTNGRNYSLGLINIPIQQNEIDENVKRERQTLEGGINMEKKTVTGALSLLQEKAIFEMDFRSSRYTTLEEKINRSEFAGAFPYLHFPGVHEIQYNFVNKEGFEPMETSGNEPLIDLAFIPENDWYREAVKPLVYPSSYPPQDLFIRHRNVNSAGFPPLKSVKIRQTREDDRFAFINTFPLLAFLDYRDLRREASNKYLSDTSIRWYGLLLNTPFPGLYLNREYSLRIRYRLPGRGIITSSFTLNKNIE